MKIMLFERFHFLNNTIMVRGKAVILLLFIVSVGLNSFGQSFFELNSKLAEMRESGDTIITREANYIKSLTTELHPTVYVGEDVTAITESLPLRADIKAGSLGKLSIGNPLFEKVELITIRFSSPAELATTLDLSLIQGFMSLRYIRILCSFECDTEQLGAIVTGNTSGIKVFYSISIPS